MIGRKYSQRACELVFAMNRKEPVFHFNRIVTCRSLFFCVEVISSTLLILSLSLWLLLLKSDTTIQRYRNRNLEPEPGTVHNICKLEHFAPQEIYIIIIYRGGGQFNDSIKQRMNIVVALHDLHGKTCFVIARPFFLSVLI